MEKIELLKFESDQALAQAASEHWLELLESHASSGALFSVALSGGRIARTFFTSAAELLKGRSLSLSSPHFFWGDERCVPPDDMESNFRLADELLLKPLRILPAQVHRIRGEDLPERAAADAASELCRTVQADSAGQPVLDLIFLGMGEDGHVASLFPSEPEEFMTDGAVYRAVVASKPPPQRISIGYQVLAAARQVWVLASGAGKEEALRESLSPQGQTSLARVLRLRTATRIYTDIRT